MSAVSVNLDVRDVVAALRCLRAVPPRVQAVVGPDVAPMAADVLAAVGASTTGDDGATDPSGAGAVLLVGLGSLDERGVTAARASAHAASERGARWVLDPDTASGPEWLARSAVHLLAARPRAVRGTAAEVMSLAGCGDVVGGPESIERAFHVANDLARRTGAVVAVSGEVDLVTDGERAVRVVGGDAAVARVAGVGTALSALVAAYTAVVDDALLAAVAAHAHAAVAAELAAAPGRPGGGPGAAARFVDALRRVDEAALAGARLA